MFFYNFFRLKETEVRCVREKAGRLEEESAFPVQKLGEGGEDAFRRQGGGGCELQQGKSFDWRASGSPFFYVEELSI